jgi:ATP-binding cassette subfamily F protein 3
MLTVNKVSMGFGPKLLFKDLSLRMNAGERLGLVGPNGAGKTTLFSIILQQMESDSGTVEFERGIRIGYLPQESAPAGEETVLELAAAISPEIADLYTTFRKNPDPDSPERLRATEQFVELHGHTHEARAKSILAGLAFRESDFEKPARTLSGGWIMRAHLARLLVMQPELLMLDEPTNHLDLETLGWFQDQLKNYRGAILTISHDRAFLNSICNGIIEIRHKNLHRYRGNFDDYLLEKADREAQYAAAYANQQREIAHLEAFVARFRAKATKASQAQSRLKQLEKMERLEAPESEERGIHFTFPQPPRSGQRIATLEKVRQAYGDHLVYPLLSLRIEKGERIVLVGPNGAGKSTLLKILADLVPIQAGSCVTGHNVSIGYFSQQRVEVLDLNRTVLDEARERMNSPLSDQEVRNLLGAFLFRGDDVHKKVKVLSGGEKSRLALVKLLLAPPNFLLLDEPTTHLDLASIDALIQALRDYSGTVCFVSHDVHFIRAIADRTLHINAGELTPYAGGYDYYLKKCGLASERSGLVAGLGNARPPEARTNTSPAKVSPKERRRQEAEARQAASHARRKQEKTAAALETEILSLEAEQTELSAQLEDPKTYEDAGVAVKLNRRAGEIAELLAEKSTAWEAAVEALSGNA